MHHRSAFTLIELLIVIAIIAVLAIVVVLTLNPAQLLEQGRDSNRVSDLATINSALGLFLTDQPGGSLGTVSTVYVSIPDPTATSTTGDQCQGLSLPTLPSTYIYHCAASSTYRNANGTGWIPVNFSQTSYGSPLGQLPQDPINQSSSRLYYTYTTNGTQYEVTAAIESQKYKLGGSNDVVGLDGSSLATVYAKGTNLSLEPLDYGDASLVGYWTFDEGSGSTAYDYSGQNVTGSWSGTQAGTSGYYSAGKVGQWGGAFDGSSTYINAGTPTIAGTFSIAAWENVAAFPHYGAIIGTRTPSDHSFDMGSNLASNIQFDIGNGTSWLANSSAAFSYSLNSWHYVAIVVTPTGYVIYADGGQIGSGSYSGTPVFSDSTHSIRIGYDGHGSEFSDGLIDDVRVYSRALSASEIQAMYNGGK